MSPSDSHPIALLADLRAAEPSLSGFEFSRYVYVPRKTEDRRQVHLAPATEVEAHYHQLCASLGPEEDVAFHSSARLDNGDTVHLPMVDLSTPEFRDEHAARLGEVFRRFGAKSFYLYRTGRSYHAYGIGILSQSQLSRFFGNLLLLNAAGTSDFVDSRWVGHRLLAGFGSLRWTCNGPQYKRVPELVGVYS